MARSPLTAAGVLLAALAVAAVVLERDADWQRLRSIAGSKSVPGEAVGSTRFGRSLHSLGLLHPIPRGRRRDAPAASLGPIPARRGSTPDQLALGRPRGNHMRAAYRVADLRRELLDSVPVVSLLVPQARLDEIHARPFLRGRQSERAAYLGFLESGEPVLSQGVGVRIHGGGSRGRKSWRGYRLTARRSYGHPRFSPAPFLEARDQPAADLVLRPNRGPDRHGHMWFFSSPLAMDIARRAGAEAPRTRPVLLMINGSYQGPYELTEHLGPKFIESRYGLGEFVLVRTKQNKYESGPKVKLGPEQPYDELLEISRESRNGDHLDRAEDLVDLDNLYRWVVAVTFLDTRDVFQGALVRDLADPAARWFWIAWDLEISFGLPQYPQQDGWRENSLAIMLKTGRADPRRWLFQGLMTDPDRRRRFIDLAVETLNHRLTPAFLEDRLAFYRDQAERFGIEDRTFLDELTDYLRNRPSAYRRHLQVSFDLGPMHRLRIGGRAGSQLEVDGHSIETPWQGEYFSGMTTRITAPPGSVLSVDDTTRVVERDPLEITLNADREIRLLPAAS